MRTGTENEESHGPWKGGGNWDEGEEDGRWEMGEDHCLSCQLKIVEAEGLNTLIFPNRFAIDEARIIEAAAMMLVVKKREPSMPSLRPNFCLKNQTIQELYGLVVIQV